MARTTLVNSLAVMAAALPPHVSLRIREASQRRPELARSYCADIPLRNAAAPHACRMAYPAVADLVSQSVHPGDVCNRVGAALCDFRSGTVLSASCFAGVHYFHAFDCADWQLRLLQSGNNCALPAALR